MSESYDRLKAQKDAIVEREARTQLDVARVMSLCEEIGYGRVMEIAATAWRAKDPVGALTVGPCVGATPSITSVVIGHERRDEHCAHCGAYHDLNTRCALPVAPASRASGEGDGDATEERGA